MDVLVPYVDRPPGDLINELSSLATRREIAWDPVQDNPALAWRIIRQPDDWEGLVDEVYNRLDRVRAGCTSCMRRASVLHQSVYILAGLLCYGMSILTWICVCLLRKDASSNLETACCAATTRLRMLCGCHMCR